MLSSPCVTCARPCVAADGRKLIELEKDSSKQLVKLLTSRDAELHPDQKYLRELIGNQLTVLGSKYRRCMWHPKVLEFCTAIYIASPTAYAEAVAGGILALPSVDHVKKMSRKGSTVERV